MSDELAQLRQQAWFENTVARCTHEWDEVGMGYCACRKCGLPWRAEERKPWILKNRSGG